ncbi:unnamed protein product [Heligmosomoides polygyrus]|uniref:RH1 domain-containing protein n=1 Tax=Heligmosomoides polygyrus TaxID=6339 RepID=A0A183G1D9_HELPZ|nr:unnamed protein product [Heligmosomoides polygyrus]
MEYKLKLHEDRMESMIQTLIAVSSKLLPNMEEVKTRLDRIESHTTNAAKNADIKDDGDAGAVTLDNLQQDVAKIKELLETHNYQKLSFEIDLLQGRFDTVNERLTGIVSAVSQPPAEPTPRYGEAEYKRTGVAKVRNDIKEIATEIEEKEASRCRDRPAVTRVWDELKEKRERLREHESRLERELNSLEEKHHKESRAIRDHRQSHARGTPERRSRRDEPRHRGNEGHSREEYGRSEKSRVRDDERYRDRSHVDRRPSRDDSREPRPPVSSIVIRPPGV